MSWGPKTWLEFRMLKVAEGVFLTVLRSCWATGLRLWTKASQSLLQPQLGRRDYPSTDCMRISLLTDISLATKGNKCFRLWRLFPWHLSAALKTSHRACSQLCKVKHHPVEYCLILLLKTRSLWFVFPLPESVILLNFGCTLHGFFIIVSCYSYHCQSLQFCFNLYFVNGSKVCAYKLMSANWLLLLVPIKCSERGGNGMRTTSPCSAFPFQDSLGVFYQLPNQA